MPILKPYPCIDKNLRLFDYWVDPSFSKELHGLSIHMIHDLLLVQTGH